MTDATSNVGTDTYMAPEVKQGLPYTSKVDLYSLGIMLVELWVPFSTGHERLQILQGCRNGQWPEVLQQEHPVALRLVHALLRNDADARPSALQVWHHTFRLPKN